jgi:Ca-activated chloride channel family protein
MLLLALMIGGAMVFVVRQGAKTTSAAAAETETPGALQVLDANGKSKGVCPLKHTTVKAEISGFLSRVSVTQEFENPFKDKIEAVYTFPLPQNAAVDDMTMVVGDRTVRGKIMRREQAQAVYEAARNAGQVASLLDQERPNIFTQSVANIMPGERVTVTLSYVETLKYEDGTYEFVFPMVVGPRYVPGAPAGQQGGGFSPDTTKVPDGSRITPQVAAKGTRAGHDISLEVTLDAGVPLDELKSNSHEVDIERHGGGRSVGVKLKDKETIPNKDFVLKYDVAGRKVEDAVLTHRSSRGGFFTLILQPPDRVTAEDVTPKEIVFVLDTSGSMSGFPIEKAKEAMRLALEGMYPQDTFNLITFAGDTSILFPQPVPATKENLSKAQKFLETREGGGGTEMMKAISAALDPSDASDHIRIVCFMTDGYVGDDMAIISEVQKHPNARVFSFGIGSSVNRFLLDKMAEYGRGEVEYVSLTDDGSAAARRFHERVRSPLLTDINVDWAGLPVADVYPQRIPDLFSAKPVILSGRYTNGQRGVIRLKGKMSGRDFVREIPIELPDKQPQHDVLATLWARQRIDNLMGQDYNGAQHGQMRPELQEIVTQLGLEYRLMTQFTSFVAVEEMTITDGGVPRRVEVPIEMPEGVSRQGVFGEEDERRPMARKSLTYVGGSLGGRNRSGGAGGGTAMRKPVKVKEAAKTPPPPPLQSRPSGTFMTEVADDPGVALSPEERKRQEMLVKLHPSIIAVIERLTKKNSQPDPDEARYVREGLAEVQIWLTDKTPEAIAQLKQLGFEIVLEPKTGKLLIGRLPVGKLSKLADLKFVRYVAPQLN